MKISYNQLDYGFTDLVDGWIVIRTGHHIDLSEYNENFEEAIKDGLYDIFMHTVDAFVENIDITIMAIRKIDGNAKCVLSKEITIGYGWESK